MAYVVQPTADVYYVPDALLADYQAAGWTQANATQIASWQAADPYGGAQGAPPAPPLVNAASGVAPTPVTEAN